MSTLSNDTINLIEQLREQGKSYAYIAKMLGRTKDSINKYCRRHNLGDGFNGKSYLEEQRLNTNEINNRFKDKFPSFEYISGYKNCESVIKIRCRKCGSIIERCSSILRKDKNLTCDNCNNIKSTEKIKEAEVLKISRQQNLEKRMKEEEIKKQKYIESHTKTCEECGNIFIARQLTHKCCSPKCSKKRENRLKELNRRHKLRENGKVDYSISLYELIKKDKGICHICDKQIDLNDYHIDVDGNFIAGESYPSIDHVIPVAKGGTHTWDNVSLAHRSCNNLKNDKIYIEDSKGQLKMYI